MRRRLLARVACYGLAVVGVAPGLAEAPPGTVGFVVTIDVDGVVDPVLRTVTIQAVQPGLPAAMAGVATGDTITEIEGRQVAGAKARALEPLMRKRVGETLSLKLRRSGGDTYVVSLTAVARR